MAGLGAILRLVAISMPPISYKLETECVETRQMDTACRVDHWDQSHIRSRLHFRPFGHGNQSGYRIDSGEGCIDCCSHTSGGDSDDICWVDEQGRSNVSSICVGGRAGQRVTRPYDTESDSEHKVSIAEWRCCLVVGCTAQSGRCRRDLEIGLVKGRFVVGAHQLSSVAGVDSS